MTQTDLKTSRGDQFQADREAFQMSPRRKTALVAGVLYLLTFVSIPTLALYGQVKGANYILGAGPDTAAIIGGVLEIIVALVGIGTAVVLFPVLKKQPELEQMRWSPAMRLSPFMTASSSSDKASCRL